MRKTKYDIFLTVIMVSVTIAFVMPILIVAMNSVKGQFYISTFPFSFPNRETFVGLENYRNGILKTDFFRAIGYSLWITVASTVLILLCTSMTAWFLQRWETKLSKILFYLFNGTSVFKPFNHSGFWIDYKI